MSGAVVVPEGGDTRETSVTNVDVDVEEPRVTHCFEFSNIYFEVVNKKKEKKVILDNVQGRCRSGRVLAIMGPSGAGKTTLISVLSLNAFSGVCRGSVKLDGLSMSRDIFTERCYVVTQQDNHWPVLTALEAMNYAADLYLTCSREEKQAKVDAILQKMGLKNCMNTIAGNEFMVGMSNGEKRRLSIAFALIKQPTLIFLDEPTSGLDAAAAAHIMTFITELAVTENLIIIATIHQPSTKVYNGFDQIMILSQGREAYQGPKDGLIEYFASIGKKMPSFTNPAEFVLDLVNNDFASQEEVLAILDQWKSHSGKRMSVFSMASAESKLIDVSPKRAASMVEQVKILFSRELVFTRRDPVLWIGRSVIFLVGSIYFTIVYVHTRSKTQDQVLSKMWLNVWYTGIPTNLGVIRVFAINAQLQSIRREIKNGMISPYTYLFTKTLLELPLIFLCSFPAVVPAAYGIVDYNPESLLRYIVTWSAGLYAWESFANVCAAQFPNPMLGVMNFMGMWFSGFLYGGFLISGADMVWPLKTFYYILPTRYTIRSLVYADFKWSTFKGYDDCLMEYAGKESRGSCFGTTGGEVLQGLNLSYSLFEDRDTFWADLGYTMLIAVVFQLAYFFILVSQVKKASKITGDETM